VATLRLAELSIQSIHLHREEPGYVVPRDTRIKLVGKFEAVETQFRVDELKQLERELHRKWRAERGQSDELISAGAESTNDGVNDLAPPSNTGIPDSACEDFQANHTDVREMFR
jgi:hypothetical protein